MSDATGTVREAVQKYMETSMIGIYRHHRSGGSFEAYANTQFEIIELWRVSSNKGLVLLDGTSNYMALHDLMHGKVDEVFLRDRGLRPAIRRSRVR